MNRPRAAVTDDSVAACRKLRAAIERVGWSETARRCGMDRTALYRAFANRAPGHMTLTTFAAAAAAVGLRIHVADDGTAL